MKKKVLPVIMAFVFGSAAMSAATIQSALAQGMESQMETADFSEIAGSWKNADSEGETLIITEDGFFIYINEDEDFQGYLEYVDGDGCYDMYNGEGIWLAGIYQDSENSLYMGIDEGTVFTRTEEYFEEQWEEAQNSRCVLISPVRYTDLVPLYCDSSWNGGYFYSDMTGDGLTVIVNCCAENGEDSNGMSEEFRKEFAAMVSESEVRDYQDSQNQSLSEKFTYPVYDITFTTGANEDPWLWKMMFFQTDTHTYAYAFKMNADAAEYMEEEYWNAVNSLRFMDISHIQTVGCILVSDVQYTGFGPLYCDFSWNGGYFYSDMTEDGLTIIVNCCAENGEDSNGMSEEFRKEFAAMVSESEVRDYQDSQNQSLSEKFTYPVYDITFTTGVNEDPWLWKMMFFQTDTHTYAYAFKMNADAAEYMEGEYWNAVNSLEFIDISYMQTEEMDYDPSANGESLEEFIAYFYRWYQYGDLNAESICLYGDGTWEFYNAINEDGTGGYLYDCGTFIASGTTALQLYSSDGSYVADVSLNEYGELMLTPVNPGYGSFYAEAAFIRE